MGCTFSLKMVGTKILVSRSWYEDPGALVPRSWYQDLGTKIQDPGIGLINFFLWAHKKVFFCGASRVHQVLSFRYIAMRHPTPLPTRLFPRSSDAAASTNYTDLDSGNATRSTRLFRKQSHCCLLAARIFLRMYVHGRAAKEWYQKPTSHPHPQTG